MLIVMSRNATAEQIQRVVRIIEAKGFTARPIPGGDRVSIGILNNEGPVDPALFLGLSGVKEAIP
ncbi:MAG: 3-deoxy-7-phosphoheptulonate synthase, partial [Desulfatitalea sp.]|nr:3-deoxy-7-phosphoheptulonate synthase [Desulfatitalea sp.]